jgi:hypothetical protein
MCSDDKSAHGPSSDLFVNDFLSLFVILALAVLSIIFIPSFSWP